MEKTKEENVQTLGKQFKGWYDDLKQHDILPKICENGCATFHLTTFHLTRLFHFILLPTITLTQTLTQTPTLTLTLTLPCSNLFQDKWARDEFPFHVKIYIMV